MRSVGQPDASALIPLPISPVSNNTIISKACYCSNIPKQVVVVQLDYRQHQDVTDANRNAPTLGAETPHDSIKNETLTWGGGEESANQQLLSPEIRQILARGYCQLRGE